MPTAVPEMLPRTFTATSLAALALAKLAVLVKLRLALDWSIVATPANEAAVIVALVVPSYTLAPIVMSLIVNDFGVNLTVF